VYLSPRRKWMYCGLVFIPAFLFIAGVGLNVACMVANHNQMPVLLADECSREALDADGADPIHTCYTPQTRLKFLGDWIYIRVWDGYFSPGDFLILSGLGLFVPFLTVLVALVLNDYKFFG
jgi:Family of unknown function (DUF5317)